MILSSYGSSSGSLVASVVVWLALAGLEYLGALTGGRSSYSSSSKSSSLDSSSDSTELSSSAAN
eukprot:CAMPEP_0113455160 /NCGR_PEP_ID=MMETSP0014_2-20120614/8233_1 /TAXON_ID=2857 /ORGANISM="Nitzschia sp." /LENGTH=63 /DNA_ID=CAMNT_0000346583 /DNA_START=385 /DNA_END=576 /DNA_ORIENTATION=+ /assembly_acc=CAM_ASM_000159